MQTKEKENIIHEATEEILKLVDDKEKLTRSDTQGIAWAIVKKVITKLEAI